MSRSGYVDDFSDQEMNMYRGRVLSAMRGKRGQALLKDVLAGMDAMPVKRLIPDLLIEGGERCALGAGSWRRGIDRIIGVVEPDEHDILARLFNVSPCLIAEIEYVNDEGSCGDNETPEKRFERVRAWLVGNILSGDAK